MNSELYNIVFFFNFTEMYKIWNPWIRPYQPLFDLIIDNTFKRLHYYFFLNVHFYSS